MSLQINVPIKFRASFGIGVKEKNVTLIFIIRYWKAGNVLAKEMRQAKQPAGFSAPRKIDTGVAFRAKNATTTAAKLEFKNKTTTIFLNQRPHSI